MSSSSDHIYSKAKKPIPKRLEADILQAASKYRNEITPTRHTTVADLLNDSLEKAMYDEVIGPALGHRNSLSSYDISSSSKPLLLSSSSSRGSLSRSGSRILSKDEISSVPTTSFKISKPISSSSSTSSDFNTSLVSRLATVEGELKALRNQYSTKLKLCHELESENYELREKFTSYDDIMAEMKITRQKNDLLQQQIREMEDFLSDYGLEWVGIQPSSIQTPSESSYHGSYHEFKKKIHELNAMIASEPTEVILSHDNKKARLVNPSENRVMICICYYNNGLMINRGPFRPSTSSSYESFMRDILDGYYPAEFKALYPEGVIFDLVDKHQVDYHDDGDMMKEDAMSVSEMLTHMPRTVIRNGEVINIRDDVEAKIIIRMNHHQHHNQPSIIISPYMKHDEDKHVNITIRWFDGSIIKGKFLSDDHISVLRNLLNQHYHIIDNHSYSLKTVYPQKLELDDMMTFVEADLVPNGTIYVMKR